MAHTEYSQDQLPDAEVIAALRTRMPDLYFVNTPVARMRRDLEWLKKLPQERLILDFHRPAQSPLTELTICAFDDDEPGLLAKVSGALLARGVNIHTAFIHTIAAEHSTRRIAFDTLFISDSYLGQSRLLSTKKTDSVRQELSRVLCGEVEVESFFKGAFRRAETPLEIFEFEARNEGDYTCLKLAAQDHPGVLYRLTNALAALHLNIVLGQVNTFESSVDDVFYLTNLAGQPLAADEVRRLEGQLRTRLQQ